jgi:flagellar hook assembly protein FlgD
MIRFQLPAASPVELAVFDIAGQRIRTLLRGNIEAGHHEAAWDGRDATGHSVASGVYLAVLSGVDFRHTHSMLLLR